MPDHYEFIGDIQQKTINAQNTGNPSQDVASLVKQLESAYSQPTATRPLGPLESQSPMITNAEVPSKAFQEATPASLGQKIAESLQESGEIPSKAVAAPKEASLESYKMQQKINTLTEPKYSEEIKVKDAFSQINPENIFINKMANMYKKTPKERAEIGSKLGGTIGLAAGGVVGSIIGANFGAMAARAAGQIQTGELEDANRRTKMYDVMNTMGIAAKNKISFEDGSSFELNPDPSIKIPNMSSMVSGQKDRTLYEVDTSNPLSNRAVAAAKPISYMLSAGLMQWNDLKNAKDAKSLSSTTGVLVNALLQDTDNIQTVYSRARQVAAKAGISKTDMLSYFKAMEGKISDSEMQTILKAIETIYA